MALKFTVHNYVVQSFIVISILTNQISPLRVVRIKYSKFHSLRYILATSHLHALISIQPVMTKKRDKILKKVGFSVKKRDKLKILDKKGCNFGKIGDILEA